mgnify:CR=1 FL=1
MNDGTRNSGVNTLRAYSEFRRVYATKTRFFRNGLGFCYRRAENLVFRFGISIPKHFGKAVERNKLRRRIKEIIRHCHSVPLNSEIVFCVRKPCSEFTFDSLKQICEWGFNKISHSEISD